MLFVLTRHSRRRIPGGGGAHLEAEGAVTTGGKVLAVVTR
jgi:hypothetical protein